MAPFASYVNTIQQLAVQLMSSSTHEISKSEIHLVLDGQPMQALRETISIVALKKSGAFFTHHELSNELVASIIPDLKKGLPIIDPACGAGNLLLACAHHLPIMKNIKDTISKWGSQLYGYDLHPEFLRATKLRLILLAIKRGAKGRLSDINSSELFPNIQKADYLLETNLLDTNCIIINPPYSNVKAPPDCNWASGSISKAALFMEKCVSTATAGTKMVALLPDVLRTGSRYSKWRDKISKYSKIESIKIIGQFDRLTDIDVFLLKMTVRRSTHKQTNNHWWNFNGQVKSPDSVIGDLFAVSVGSVVPHRDPQKGKWYPYIYPRLLPSWITINTNTDIKKRRYNGTVFKPPFVVIRRTSRPGDKYRAIGSIIQGKSHVAVENHLIICVPKSGHLYDCHNLLKLLKSDSTNEWLNQRIRCRHLTINAIRELPWRLLNSE